MTVPWWAAAAAAALVSLDRSLVGQWMLSRPAVLGPALGAMLGDVQTGWWVGLLFEMISLDAEPVGGVIGLNGTVGTAAVLLAAFGPYRLALSAAFPLGLAVGTLFAPLEEGLRRRRDAWTPAFASSIRETGRAPWLRAYGNSLAEEFAATAATLLLAATVVAALGVKVWAVAPLGLRGAFDDALAAAPLVGAAALLWRLVGKNRFGF